MSSYILPILASRISFVILECPVEFVLFDPVLVSFKSPSFHQYFLIYLLKLQCSVFLLFCFSFFIPTYSRVFPFLSIFVCCRNFLKCFSNLISHPSFELLFAFLRETPILSQTNFASAEINSFNSVMLFVVILVNNLFILSVSTLIFSVLVPERW